jgi:hypothetical protein
MKTNNPDTEKAMTDHLEKAILASHESNGDELSPSEEKKIIRKIDRRLITALGLMFAVSLMDRTNLASANIAGMAKELELDQGFRYVSDHLMIWEGKTS